ncbi:slipin family protein [Eggerthella lenta]|uniref:slipin family protein n=1 Tax=Eggerthella lenta TaxID=84112 RepID=UPI003B585D05
MGACCGAALRPVPPLAGPGLYVTVPVVDSVTIVIDQRISSISCSAEQVLTADLVPVDLDAVVFWMVWDPKKACLAVEDYEHSASLVAQTALRDAIGQVEIAELSMQRAHIDHQLKKSIEEKTEQWGVTMAFCSSWCMRMSRISTSMSAEAQAQQERNARVVLAEVEKDISDMFIEAAHAYREDDLALQLRMMSLVNESVKEGGNMVVVPSPYAQGFTGDIASALKGKK